MAESWSHETTWINFKVLFRSSIYYRLHNNIKIYLSLMPWQCNAIWPQVHLIHKQWSQSLSSVPCWTITAVAPVIIKGNVELGAHLDWI